MMARVPRIVLVLVMISLLAGFAGSPVYGQATKWGLRPMAMGKLGMVASANALASLAGIKILEKGGNAVDAIVAMAAALNVVEPNLSSMGGIGYMLLYSAREGRVRALDFAGRAPMSAAIDKLDVQSASRGPKAPLVPGNVAGWAKALKDYGTLPLWEVFAPAIEYAEKGRPVTPYEESSWANLPKTMAPYRDACSVYLKDGKDPYKAGDLFVNKALAKSLRRVAEEGIDVFYKGDMAQEIAAAFERDGGFITVADLAAYPETVEWRDPLSVDYRGYAVYTNPVPGQGIQILQELAIMEGFDVGAMGHNSVDYLTHLFETIYLCRLDTDKYIADPGFVSVPVEMLLSDAYLAKQREKVVLAVQEKKKVSQAAGQAVALGDAAGEDAFASCTTHLSAVDRWGNAVNVTQTLDGGWGSYYVPGTTGILFNNGMYRWSLEPGRIDVLEPGKHASYCMGLLQIHKNGKPYMLVGSPGNYGILQTVPQIAMNVLDFGMNIQDAIGAPRFRWNDNYVPAKDITMENRVPREVVQKLWDMGYVINLGGDWTSAVGGAQGIVIDQATGWLMGGADPRRNGYALGW